MQSYLITLFGKSRVKLGEGFVVCRARKAERERESATEKGDGKKMKRKWIEGGEKEKGMSGVEEQ